MEGVFDKQQYPGARTFTYWATRTQLRASHNRLFYITYLFVRRQTSVRPAEPRARTRRARRSGTCSMPSLWRAELTSYIMLPTDLVPESACAKEAKRARRYRWRADSDERVVSSDRRRASAHESGRTVDSSDSRGSVSVAGAVRVRRATSSANASGASSSELIGEHLWPIGD